MMMKNISTIVVLLFVVYANVANSTNVLHCQTGDDYEDSEQVKITACDDSPCMLPRGSDIEVWQRFTSPKDTNSLKTKVNAKIIGVSLPFIGVDGTDACRFIYNLDGTKAGCPLQKGKEYIYKIKFPVLQVYPKLDTVVHWALSDGRNELTCFEVPASIV